MLQSKKFATAALGVLAVIATAVLSTSPAEARHGRHGWHHHHGWHHGWHHRHARFYPRPGFYPRPAVAAAYYPPPIYAVRPVAYLPPPPPPFAYGYGYGYHSGYAYRRPVKKRAVKKVSHKPACVCNCCPEKQAAPETPPATEK